jgi:hypothetical protein
MRCCHLSGCAFNMKHEKNKIINRPVFIFILICKKLDAKMPEDIILFYHQAKNIIKQLILSAVFRLRQNINSFYEYWISER